MRRPVYRRIDAFDDPFDEVTWRRLTGLPRGPSTYPTQSSLPLSAGRDRSSQWQREYEAAKIAGNARPPDWFPEEYESVFTLILVD
jgi:hypothetical protein